MRAALVVVVAVACTTPRSATEPTASRMPSHHGGAPTAAAAAPARIADDVGDRVFALATASIAELEPFAGDDSEEPHTPGGCQQRDPYHAAWCAHQGDRRATALALADLYRGDRRGAVGKDLGALLSAEYTAGEALSWIHFHVITSDNALLDDLAGSYVAREQWREVDDVLAATTGADTCARAAARIVAETQLHRPVRLDSAGACPAAADLACWSALAEVGHRDDLQPAGVTCAAFEQHHPTEATWLVGALERARLDSARTADEARDTVLRLLELAAADFDHPRIQLAVAALTRELVGADCTSVIVSLVRYDAAKLAALLHARTSVFDAFASATCTASR